MTEAEQELWIKLRRRQIERCKFRRQYSIMGFVVDFYCPEKRLAIEVDGGYHRKKNQLDCDQARQKLLETLNICFLRFSNDEVFNDLDLVTQKIRDQINSSYPHPLSPSPLIRGKGNKGLGVKGKMSADLSAAVCRRRTKEEGGQKGLKR